MTSGRTMGNTEQGSPDQADRPADGQQIEFEAKRARFKQEPDLREYGTELRNRGAVSAGTGRLAKGLGYFSLALGLSELLMPAQVGEAIGVNQKYRSALPALGLREIGHGLAILKQQRPTSGVWSRVAGDAVDLAYLGAAYMGEANNKRRVLGAAIAVLGITAVDALVAQKLSQQDWGAQKNPTAPTTVGQPSARQTSGILNIH